MKKILIILLSFMFILSGCNSKEFRASNINKNELYLKMQEASKNINSFSTKAVTSLTISKDGVSSSTQLKFNLDFILKELQAHLKLELILPQSTNIETHNLELYLKDKTIYIAPFELLASKWTKYSIEEEIIKSIVEKVEDETDNDNSKVTILENSDQYLIKSSLNKEQLKKIIDEKKEEYPQYSDFPLEVFQLDSEVYVDKKTYYVSKMKLKFDIKSEMDLKLEIEADNSNYNSVKEIEVPKEALNATE